MEKYRESCDVERKSGVDALRVFAMLGVVWLHVNARVAFGEHYDSYFCWMSGIDGCIHSFAILSVNCFALVSGYLLSVARARSDRILRLWIQVIAWSGFSALLAFCVFGKPFAQYFDVYRYWYVNAYTCVLLLLPALNILVRAWDENVRGGLVIVLTLCLVGHFLKHDIFGLRHGYSALWLLCLYCVGGLIRRREHLIRRFPRMAVFACGAICAIWGTVALAPFRPKSFAVGHSLWNLVDTYTSPLVLAGAVLLFGAVLRMRCPCPRVLSFLSRHCFAVYLIHMSCLGYEGLTWLHTTELLPQSKVLMAICELLIVIGIFVVCVGLDAIRTTVFSKLRIDMLVELIGRRIDSLLGGTVKCDEIRLNCLTSKE